MNNKMFYTFTEDPIHIDDVVVFLRNHRTGSSTTRKNVNIYSDILLNEEDCQKFCDWKNEQELKKFNDSKT